MTHFTDIFIKRPVLATVISLLILVFGLRSIFSLPIREYPYTQNAVITVSTVYTGANPELIAGFITTPLENAIAQAQGIDYLTSVSTQNVSTIKANLLLNYDPNKALSEINTKVNSVLNQLPPETLQPVLSISIGETIDSMYIGFYSQELAPNQITDYLVRSVQPKIQTINGVQTAEIIGQKNFALRAWLDPIKMAAHGLTPNDIKTALANNDFISAAGRTDGQMYIVNLKSGTHVTDVQGFKRLVVKSQENGAIVRLEDVANVSLGSNTYDTSVQFNGKPAVYIGIKVTPSANLLAVIDEVKTLFPTIQSQLPQGLEAKIVYDATSYVNASIEEVESSILEALLIVTIVIFLFLGSVRSVIIPLIAIPLSLIGAFLIMLMLGYSINLLTLLALVLAIGLVVDDAIIVVENVHRHIENNMKPFDAAILGARELAMPIIAISVVLIAVYFPIAFMGGLTGALFTEFAFTLAGSVGISAIIALTLSPMMCSRSLKKVSDTKKHKYITYIETHFQKLEKKYKVVLNDSLNYLTVTAVFTIIIFTSIYFLYITAKSELAPQEDQGIIIASLTAAPNASLTQTELYASAVFDIFKKYPETDHIFQIDGVGGLNASTIGMVFQPWNERDRTTNELQPKIQNQLNDIAGARVAAFQNPPLPGGGEGLPVQFVITTTEDFSKLNTIAQQLKEKAENSGMFVYTDLNLKIDKEQVSIEFDRDLIAELGLNMNEIGNVLAWALSGNYVNYFDFYNRSYQVIPQMLRINRLNAQQILDYYITLPNGIPIKIGTFSKIVPHVVPETINHFQQLNSATLSAVPAPSITQGDSLNYLNKMANAILPSGYSIDYAAQSRQYMQETSGIVMTFVFALIIIFLVLAAQFESFKDPLIILISVPMSVCGAMIFVSMGIGGMSLNIYTQVGLVTLIGLISKHGILIVQFANDLQKEGLNKREAIVEAASIRLRPILMTTAAMVLGVIPLILASGAGAVSRFNIGVVIASGVSIGTLFTLFVVPAMYMFLATKIEPEADVAPVNDI